MFFHMFVCRLESACVCVDSGGHIIPKCPVVLCGIHALYARAQSSVRILCAFMPRFNANGTLLNLMFQCIHMYVQMHIHVRADAYTCTCSHEMFAGALCIYGHIVQIGNKADLCMHVYMFTCLHACADRK